MVDETSQEFQSEEITAEVELATVEDLIQDTETEVDLQLDLRSDPSTTSRCVVITRVPESGFPATITLDFGDGCEGPNGRVRAGQIIVRQTDSLKFEGAERVLTFNGFSVDDVQIEGSRILTNQGFNEAGQPVWERQVVDALVTFPDGSTMTWNSNYRRTQIQGFQTARRIDDVFRLVGYTSGTSRNGVAFKNVITEPLVNGRDCRWIQSGVIEVTRDGVVRSIDFGKGFCDPIATITNANGQTRRVLLDRKWWQQQSNNGG